MEYTIYIKNQTSGSGGGEDNNSFPDSQDENQQPAGANKFKAAFKGFAVAYAATAIPRQIFRYELSRVGVRTGNSHIQDKINFGMQLAGDIGGILMSAVGGLAIGGGIGAAIGLATSAASVGLGYMQKIDQYEYGKEWESISLWQTRLRAGPSLNRSREH